MTAQICVTISLVSGQVTPLLKEGCLLVAGYIRGWSLSAKGRVSTGCWLHTWVSSKGRVSTGCGLHTWVE